MQSEVRPGRYLLTACSIGRQDPCRQILIASPQNPSNTVFCLEYQDPLFGFCLICQNPFLEKTSMQLQHGRVWKGFSIFSLPLP